MKNRQLIALVTILMVFVGCEPNTDNIEVDNSEINMSVAKVKNLSGLVYFFGLYLDTTTCRVDASCDCCASHILFLDDKNFITISYCESDESIFKGTYKINNDKVLLQYNTTQVEKEYDWAKESDTTGTIVESKYLIKIIKSKATNVVLKSMSCNGKICFKVGDTEVDYGSIDTETTLEKEINRLKTDSIWDKLR